MPYGALVGEDDLGPRISDIEGRSVAIGLTLDPGSALAGFVVGGDRVEVFTLTDVSTGHGTESIGAADVLAALRPAEGGKRTYVLAVSPIQAEAIRRAPPGGVSLMRPLYR